MNALRSLLSLAVALALTVGGGIIHGRLSNRWGPPGRMVEAAARLQRIPVSFGKWQLKASDRLSDGERTMLECAGELVRTYVNQETGELVGVTLIVGPPGPTAEHTPEVCFSSQNYRRLKPRQSVTIETPRGCKNELWMVDFRARDVAARSIRMCYGWTAGGPWSATANPRFEFVGKPHLYKVQATGFVSPLAEGAESDPIRVFLKEFLAVAQNQLIDASKE